MTVQRESPGPVPGAPAGDQARFGSSFLMADGDLVLSGGGLRLVDGVDNLKQALSLRLLTPYGSDQVNATYGLDVRRALSGGNSRRMVKELIRLEVVRTLAADPRVREVTGVRFDDDPDFAEQVRAAGGRPAPRGDRLRQVVVTVETVRDTTTSILADVGF